MLNLSIVKLYHWTLNAEKVLNGGFRNRAHRHPDDKEGVWFTDKLLGPGDGIRKDMKVLVVNIPSEDVKQYEESNTGSGYRTFSIPEDIVNKCEISCPTVYSDRGIYKINQRKKKK